MNALLDLGPHAGFIWMAYGISALVLAGLIGWIRIDARRQLNLLAELEAKGIRRRSDPARASQGKRRSTKS
jgi:heme exporter protein D